MKTANIPPYAAGPIPALIQYYERLQQNSNIMLAPFGYSAQRISYVLILNPDGSLHAIEDARTQEKNGIYRPIEAIVFGMTKSPGSGISPCFLWDNMTYMLGYKFDDPKPNRTAECFREFRRLHLGYESQVDDADYSIVCRFLKRWDPANIKNFKNYQNILNGFGVFRIKSKAGFVHQNFKIKEWWDQHLKSNSMSTQFEGISLISGKYEPIARLHEPKIKGVSGAQPTGALLVSCNADAYESYGKTQSYNAPIGEIDTFKYCTALNYLLDDTKRRLTLGDTTIVFWTGHGATSEVDPILIDLFDEFSNAKDRLDLERHAGETIKNSWLGGKLLEAIHEGSRIDARETSFVPIYILGLSPNAARLNVRFWLQISMIELFMNLVNHIKGLEISDSRNDTTMIGLRSQIKEVMPDAEKESQNRYVAKLIGDLFRSVLAGQPYPYSLFDALLRKTRVQGDINTRRAAMIRAYLNQNISNKYERKIISVSLDPNYPDPIYHMGRLFATVEKAQEEALGSDLTMGVRQKYFPSASSTPSRILPIVVKLHQFHIKKLKHIGRRIQFENLMSEILGHITEYPRYLTLEKQGIFQIGYYHQRQYFFTAKNRTDSHIAEIESVENEGNET